MVENIKEPLSLVVFQIHPWKVDQILLKENTNIQVKSVFEKDYKYMKFAQLQKLKDKKLLILYIIYFHI